MIGFPDNREQLLAYVNISSFLRGRCSEFENKADIQGVNYQTKLKKKKIILHFIAVS